MMPDLPNMGKERDLEGNSTYFIAVNIAVRR
jgi:hypothetical protein